MKVDVDLGRGVRKDVVFGVTEDRNGGLGAGLSVTAGDGAAVRGRQAINVKARRRMEDSARNNKANLLSGDHGGASLPKRTL